MILYFIILNQFSNDAQFTEKDFVNLSRLGSGGKKDEIDKIGKYNLGFNAVYNLTDLPSIISGFRCFFLHNQMENFNIEI